MVLLDLSAAIATSSPAILLESLTEMGLRGVAYRWKTLSCGDQKVMLGASCSNFWTCGIPQVESCPPFLKNKHQHETAGEGNPKV